MKLKHHPAIRIQVKMKILRGQTVESGRRLVKVPMNIITQANIKTYGMDWTNIGRLSAKTRLLEVLGR